MTSVLFLCNTNRGKSQMAAGLLRALGVEILDASGQPIAEGGAALAQATRLDLSGLHPALTATPPAHVTVACDVDNPLTGEHGAAAVAH